MKKLDLEKMHTLKRWLHSQLITSFKRFFKTVGEEPEASSDLQIPMKGFVDTFSTYAEHLGMNIPWAEMEKRKAEAMQQIMRERTRYT